MKQLIVKTISRHMKDKDVIRCSQHGFTKMESCLTNLVNMMDEGRSVDIVFLDFRTTSDTVLHKTVIDKLSRWAD